MIPAEEGALRQVKAPLPRSLILAKHNYLAIVNNFESNDPIIDLYTISQVLANPWTKSRGSMGPKNSLQIINGIEKVTQRSYL
jgi:hypothetical protein